MDASPTGSHNGEKGHRVARCPVSFSRTTDDFYTAGFIHSGLSNGGNDVVAFQQSHGEDIVGSLTFGTPFMTANDERFPGFFDTVDADCQTRLEAIQFAVLTRRATVEATVLEPFLVDGFTRVDSAAAYEAAALSYPWLFWQYEGSDDDCAALPDPTTATDAELADSFALTVSVFGAFPMSDAYLSFFGPYFFEVQRDGGWPLLPRADLEAANLIRANLVDMEFGMVAEGVTAPTFDVVGNDALRAFAATASNIIFISSDSDPWSTGKIVTANTGGLVLTITNGNHTSDIPELSEVDQAAVMTTVAGWLGGAE